MTTTDQAPFDEAARLAPVPATRDQATREAWAAHFAAEALAALAGFRAALRTLEPTPEGGSRPDLGHLAGLAHSCIAAAAALTDPEDAPGLLWDLTPEAGALNGEWEDWLDDTLARHGINPADIDPDLDPADFAAAVTR